MDLTIFPVNSKILFSLVGSAILAVVVLQWLKMYLQSVFVNLICLAINLAVMLTVAWFLVDGDVAERMLAGSLLGLFGASLATFGYEALKNALKFAGVGKE